MPSNRASKNVRKKRTSNPLGKHTVPTKDFLFPIAGRGGDWVVLLLFSAFVVVVKIRGWESAAVAVIVEDLLREEEE